MMAVKIFGDVDLLFFSCGTRNMIYFSLSNKKIVVSFFKKITHFIEPEERIFVKD